jgi:NADH dehydrogenase
MPAMRIAITGGTGFIGGHLARALVDGGHEVVLIARGVDRRDLEIRGLRNARFVAAGVDNPAALARALEGCAGVAHCAGINREHGAQTYARVHVDGTRHVLETARRAGTVTGAARSAESGAGAGAAPAAPKVVLLSFLRARPDCGSAYHESKFAAEELVRASGLDFTILRPGIVYGRGDHMLDRLSRVLRVLPVFATVGLRDRPVRPLAVEDLVRILAAALTRGRLSRQTVAVTGPEQLPFGHAVRRVAQALGRPLLIVPAPVAVHTALAALAEWLMPVPLISTAQVRMLAEGIAEPALPGDPLPADLAPVTPFSIDQIRRGLPLP